MRVAAAVRSLSSWTVPSPACWMTRLRRFAAGLGILIAFSVDVSTAFAQELRPIRELPGTGSDACPPIGIVSAAPPPGDRQRARALLRDGQEAALIGDQNRALAQFSEAARLNPVDPEVAYALARVHEEMGAETDAMRELCRYLVLAPGGPDAGEVRQRIEGIVAALPVQVPPTVAEHFQVALSFYDAGRLRESDLALSYVLRESPGLAEAHFNRALVRLAQNRAGPAAQDLERYLTLAPDAADREAVSARIAELRARTVSPARVLRNGLLVPGLGQVTTRRPVFGALVFGAAGAATYVAFQTREEARTVTFEDPFGNPYQERQTVTTRPHRDLGLSAALVITVFAATEAYSHVRAGRARNGASTQAATTAKPPGPIIEPTGDGSIRLGVRVPLPNAGDARGRVAPR